MSVVEQIQALEELAAIDAEIRVLDEQIGKERGNLSALRQSLAKNEERAEKTRAALATLEKTRSDAQLEVRNMQQQTEHSREKLGRSRTERESNAAQREMEELRKLIRDREEEVTKVTVEIDLRKKELEEIQAEIQKTAQEIGATEEGTHARLGTTEGERQTRVTAREVVAKRLPVTLFKRYEMVRGRRGSGLAQTTDGTCKACNMALPPQLFHRLRREPILDQCPSCNRIIYFLPAPPAPVKDA